MLVLTRRPGQGIRIAENITFSILAIAGGNVRVGVTAPREITVDREEVHERKMLEQRGKTAPPRLTNRTI